MAYWGSQSFQNDQAADWVDELTDRNAPRRIKSALVKVISFSPENVERWSKEKIDRFVARIVCDLRDNPPLTWKESGKTLQSFLRDVESELRDEYESGRYLNKRYGPVEEGLAAAELLAIWGDQSPPRTPPYDDHAFELAAVLKRKLVPQDLVQLARDVVRQVLVNERYHHMRKFYLNAFPDMSGGDDAMAAVKNLAKRLNQIVVPLAGSATKAKARGKGRKQFGAAAEVIKRPREKKQDGGN